MANSFRNFWCRWFGHKFKQVQSGIFRCKRCGITTEGITEDTPLSFEANTPSTIRFKPYA